MSTTRSFAIQFGSSPALRPSHPSEAKPGLNESVVKSVQFGLKPMIFEKDVPVAVSDGGGRFESHLLVLVIPGMS